MGGAPRRRVDRRGLGERGDLALRAARHGARQVETGRSRGAAGQEEGVERFETGVDAVDLCLQAQHLGLAHAQRCAALVATLAAGLRPAQVGAQVEEVVLRPRQDFIELAPAVQARQADGGVGFVDRAVGRDPRGVLGDARAVDERGLALVAAAGVDARQLDH